MNRKRFIIVLLSLAVIGSAGLALTNLNRQSRAVGKSGLRPQTASDALNRHGLFDCCYVLLPSDHENVLLISDELASVVPEAGAWLSNDFFKVENVRSISVSSNDAKSWTLARE